MRHLVCIPAYNCAKQIGRVLAQLGNLPVDAVHRVLVIDNRSSDGTLEAACTAAFNVATEVLVARNIENYGLGGSQKVGFQHGLDHDFERVTILHGDDQGSITDLLPILDQPQHASKDALLGARFMDGSRLQGYSAFRTLGNRAYNLLFSTVARSRLYDLGSGLNSYRTRIFRNGFHMSFPDDLTFNYCMVLAHGRLKHDTMFFPIEWREEDQVSNVKLTRQALRVLQLLGAYARDADRFLAADHRTLTRTAYPTEIVYRNQ